MTLSRAFVPACAVLAIPTALWPGTPIAAATYLVGLLAVVGALWWGALSCPPGAARSGWRLIALAATCWFAGDVVMRVVAATGGDPDAPSVADVLWLGSYPLLVLGVGAMIRGRGITRMVGRETGLDVLVTTVAATVAAWHVLVAPNLPQAADDLAVLLAVGYPLGDVIVFAAGLTLLLAPGVRTPAVRLIAVCLGSTLAVDVCIGGFGVFAPDLDAAHLDSVLLVVNACLGAAALHPSHRTVATPGTRAGSGRVHRGRVALLGAGLAAVDVTGALPVAPTTANRAVLLGASVLVSVAVLVRFALVVREREQAEEMLRHQAGHDQLTGLANRALLVEHLDALLARAGDAGRAHPTAPGGVGAVAHGMALVYVDLDGFKAVNDAHGHAAGDEVLRVVAERLRRTTRAGDLVARLGGDEFVVVCPDVPVTATTALGAQLHDVIVEPIEVPGAGTLHVGASLGVQMVPFGAGSDVEGGAGCADGGRAASGADPARGRRAPGGRRAVAVPDVDSLLRDADSAMYRAKHDGGGVRHAVASP